MATQIVKCVLVSLWLLVEILIFGILIVDSWFSGERVLRIISIIVTAICFVACIANGIQLLI